ncbi:MAG: ABC transporter ATP-binding protein [Planctomycetota bacterium]
MTGDGSLRTKDLAVAYDRRVVVSGLDISIPAGGLTALIGPNGSGKSTMLKACARLLPPHRGAALLDGQEIHRMSSRAVARQLAVLPQSPSAPQALTVAELVAYGRFPYRNLLGMAGAEDRQAVEQALELTELRAMKHRPIGELSGGERQRAFIAMALAQDTDYLLLDEPTASLDLQHQLEIMDLLRRFRREHGKTIVVVLHDLNLAARYASYLIAIREGRVAKSGTPAAVMTPETLAEVFQIEAEVMKCSRTGAPICIAHSAIRARRPIGPAGPTP